MQSVSIIECFICKVPYSSLLDIHSQAKWEEDDPLFTEMRWEWDALLAEHGLEDKDIH